jgi:glycosyltransferase involved in cell wall biosynthesis
MSFPKTVYITSRAGTVPVRRIYMDSVQADYVFIDHKLRWHDIQASFQKKVASWVVSALTFPNRSKYQIFISSGQHYMPVFMKLMGLLRKDQKVVCYQGNETLYFLKTGRYSKWTAKALKWQLKQYDYHICLSKFQYDLLVDVLGTKDLKTVLHFNGVEEYRLKTLKDIHPDLRTNNILFIGNLYVGWRLWYKGIDLLVETINHTYAKNPQITCTMVGEIHADAIAYIQERCAPGVFVCFKFEGKQKDLGPYFTGASVYLHMARGEAFGSVVIEAMAAGLIPIVSDMTGAKEVVEQIDPKLIVPLDPAVAATKVLEVMNWPLEQKEQYSRKCKELILSHYKESDAIQNFQKILQTIADD